jgi:hypothetical protein
MTGSDNHLSMDCGDIPDPWAVNVWVLAMFTTWFAGIVPKKH